MNDDIGFEEALEQQQRACAMMGSALYAQMLVHALDEYRERGPLYRFMENDPRRERMSMPAVRLLGALHFLALDEEASQLAAHLPSCGGDADAAAAWYAASELLEPRERELSVLYADTPQTNEVARSTVLLAGACAIFAQTRLPLRLFDVGASAGLNGRLDRYRYEGDGWAWGDPASPLVLRNRTRAGTPALGDAPIVDRLGCDVHPLDIASARDRLRLLSFVWADQLDRVERLQAAFAAARHTPMRIDRADMFLWIEENARPRLGSTSVVMHSVVADHLSAPARKQLEETIGVLGASASDDAPFAWLRLEMGERRARFETRVTLWPGAHETLIARSDGHAQDITWVA